MGLCQIERPRATTTHHDLPRRPLDLNAKAEAVLRDVAYVLHLTRRVKRAVLEERAAAPAALAY